MMNDYLCFESPLGKVLVCSEEGAISDLYLGREEELHESNEAVLQEAKKQLIAYFGHERKTFDVPLSIKRSVFFTKIYQELLKVEYGKTVAYSELASRVGNPQAARAVGMANHSNRISIIVPCHRVIGKNQALVGYAGGLWRKAALLALESYKEYCQELGVNQQRIYYFGLSSVPGQYRSAKQNAHWLVEKGQVTIELENQFIELKPGDDYLIAADKKYRLQSTSWDCVLNCRYL